MSDDEGMRKTLTGLGALLLVGAVLSGCTDDGTGGGSPGSGRQTIDITFRGDSVTPNGDRVKVGVGVPVVLKIDADKEGEIHVHSTPEQEISYPAGMSTQKITIDKPGVVDVESHHLEKTVVQLEVS